MRWFYYNTAISQKDFYFIMKKCSKCNEEKHHRLFYTNKGKINSRCKVCHNTAVKKSKNKNKESYLKYGRDYYHKNKERRREYEREYYKENKLLISERKRVYNKEWYHKNKLNKEKHLVRSRTYNKIKNGTINIKDCESCGSSVSVEVHHLDYNNPDQIMFLCRQCHVDWHKFNKAIEPNLTLI